jgi:hypothetical protein
MDHPCHKCGHSIEDGKPFCLQCGAPQIRVAMPDPVAEPALASDGALPLVHAAESAFPGAPVSPLPTRWLYTVQPCAIAAGVAIGLTLLGLNPFVGAFGTGFLAVVFARRRGLGMMIRTAAGARLGAISAFLFFAVSAILETLAVVVLHKGAEVRSEMMDKVQQAAARYPGPELQPFLDFVKSPGGFTFMVVASALFGLLAFMVLGGLGGAIGASLLGRHDRPQG